MTKECKRVQGLSAYASISRYQLELLLFTYQAIFKYRHSNTYFSLLYYNSRSKSSHELIKDLVN